MVIFVATNILVSKEILAACICDTETVDKYWCLNSAPLCSSCPCSFKDSTLWAEGDYSDCASGGCDGSCNGSINYCTGTYADRCDLACGGCFVGGTSVASKQLSDQAIENLKPGDMVSSFNPETGEVSESQVSEVHKLTREGYYELETESGKKVKVTGEHPFLAIKSEENLISKLKNALSNTLTFRLITSLQAKLGEILD